MEFANYTQLYPHPDLTGLSKLQYDEPSQPSLTTPASIIQEKEIPTAEDITDTKNNKTETEKEKEETTTIVPVFLYSEITFPADCMNWVASIDKNQINLNVAPPTNVSLNLKMWTKTTINSAEVSTNFQHEVT